MQGFQEKKKFRKIIFSPISIIILTVLFVVLSVATIKIFFRSRIALEKNGQVEKELAELEKRKADMEKKITQLQTESGVDEELRDKFNMRKPGEEVVIIVDNNNDNKTENANKETGFFSKAWQAIKNMF